MSAAMGFFQTFWSWLNAQLAAYIGDNTARVSAALEPAVVTLAVLYVMGWGYLHLIGRIEEPFISGVKRIVLLAVILAVALRLWLYNAVIVDTFYQAPAQLAAAVIGGSDPIGTIDAIWDRGGAVAGQLWSKASALSGWGYALMGAAVWLLIGMLCVYAMFLIALSSIASSLLLAIGPVFIVMILFDGTRRFFDAWVAQLANYALITILTVLSAALLLRVVESYAAQTAARGAALLTVDALDMLLMAVLVFLLLRQIMPIASSLAGGLSLSSMGMLSHSIGRSAAYSRAAGRAATRTAASFAVSKWRQRQERVQNAHSNLPAPVPSWRDS
ncbi:MAG TPA: type IV secretion system protein [Steroidobacteraceae bacterium]|jgi:type IV secretion system protein VirB6|nr:type IV secretion system protein [Steroidobacteraceae bacterium]